MRLLILVLALLLASAAHADNPKLIIAQIPGAYAVTNSEAERIYSRASWYFRQLNVTFRVRRLATDSNCFNPHGLGTRVTQLRCFGNQAYNQHLTEPARRYKLVYFMTPPFTVPADDGNEVGYIAGFALGICANVATGNASRYSLPEGQNRIPHSAVVLAHEVIHLMCGTHQSTKPNVMHPSANQFTDVFRGRIPILRVTRRQVKRWKAANRRLI